MTPRSKLSLVPVDRILSRLIHPSVFELTGIVLSEAEPVMLETDGVVSHTYTSADGKGRILVRNDGIRVLMEGWYKEDKILMCAIRDRQLDGTEESSPLTFYPNRDPACNRLPGPGFLACELSIYSWDPHTYLDGLDIEGTLGHFIADPDHYVWKHFDPGVFFPLWEQAFHIGRGPWQSARPMKGVPQFFVENAIKVLTELGYNRVDAVPSWFNVARFFEPYGFRFTYGEHELMYQGLCEGLKRFADREGRSNLTRPQESWLVSLQNLPDAYIPEELKLPARWPVTHTNTYWIRMHLDLNPYTLPEREEAGESGLMKRVRGLRSKDCKNKRKLKVTVPNRGHRACSETLGASSPGATSPKATD